MGAQSELQILNDRTQHTDRARTDVMKIGRERSDSLAIGCNPLTQYKNLCGDVATAVNQNQRSRPPLPRFRANLYHSVHDTHRYTD